VHAGELVGASDIVVGVKGKYADVIDLLTPLLPSHARIVPLSDSYPSGDEFILVYDTTGRIIPPGGIPLDVGCVTINVETALNIARAAPVIEKFLTVAGAVAEPCHYRRCRWASTFRRRSSWPAGRPSGIPKCSAGGAMMGRRADLDDPITKTCGGVIVVPGSLPGAALRSTLAADRPDRGQRLRSMLVLHRVVPALPAGASDRAAQGDALAVLRRGSRAAGAGTQFCCECNLCTMIACPEDLDPKNVCTHNKRALAATGEKWQVEAHPYRAELHLDNRRVPISRLIRKLGLHPFANRGPLRDRTCDPDRVVLPLKQHAGPPADPVVASGDRVQCGDAVARPADGALGAVIHASIAGVCAVSEDAVTITADRSSAGSGSRKGPQS
jgi:Na+-translocating ferredoxin:NAD+ oxidoreductase RnfC subunit